MAGGFVGVDLFLASGRLLGSCALSVRCGPGNTGQDTIGFEIEIEITIGKLNFHKRPRYGLPPQLGYQPLTDEVVASPAVHKGQHGLIQNPLQVSLQH